MEDSDYIGLNLEEIAEYKEFAHTDGLIIELITPL